MLAFSMDVIYLSSVVANLESFKATRSVCKLSGWIQLWVDCMWHLIEGMNSVEICPCKYVNTGRPLRIGQGFSFIMLENRPILEIGRP